MSLLGAVVLLCALGLLAARPAASPGLYRAQSVALAAAAASQGLVLAVCLILAGGGLLPPLLLRRLKPADGAGAWWEPVVGVALTGVAVLAMLPVTAGSPAPVRLDLAMALAVLLVGLFGMLGRRPAWGWLSGANGVVLGAMAVGDPALADAAALALPALAAAALGGIGWRGGRALP